MSHYQSKGDRSEAQLKKAGRSSGPGHPRSGAPSAAVKGGGAGGPSPSGSAHPASGASSNPSQSYSAVPSAGRPTVSGSSTNRGGKKGNLPAGLGRSVQNGASADHGGNYRNLHYSAGHYQNQQHHAVPSIRQGVGTPDANQDASSSTGSADSKHSASNSSGGSGVNTSGGATIPLPKQSASSAVAMGPANPPAPAVPPADTAVPGPVLPVANSDTSRSAAQPSFSFQFGSITPGFMNLVPGMQVPARTNSAPPNLHEQRREQARYEASRAASANQASGVRSGQQEVQQNHGLTTQDLISDTAPSMAQSPAPGQQGLAQFPAQYPQGQGQASSVQGHGTQHSQASLHISAQVQVSQPQQLQHSQLVAAQQAQSHAQVQAQAQAQPLAQLQPQQTQPQPHGQQQERQQILSQQAVPQQSMKYPQSIMQPPHGPQIISQQMATPLGCQLPAQQVSQQLGHQLGPQMGGTLGGQLPPGMAGAPYGPPPTSQYIQPQPSRAVKIVNPNTLEELRFDAKARKCETYMDVGLPPSAATSTTRCSSNGPLQNRQLNYGGHHHPVVSSSRNYYQQSSGSYAHGGPPFFQSVLPKSVSSPPSGPVNIPVSRYGYGAVTPPGVRYMNPTPASKGTPSDIQASQVDGMSMPQSVPLVASARNVLTNAAPNERPPAAASHPPLSGAGDARGFNECVSAVTTTVTGGISLLPSLSSSPPESKFGDVESPGSGGPVDSQDAAANSEGTAHMHSPLENGALYTAEPRLLVQIQPAALYEGSSLRSEQASMSTSASTSVTPSQSVSVISLKQGIVSAAPTESLPRVATVVPSLVPVVADKSKTESPKPAGMTRENSRRVLKKESKQHKHQNQHPQPPLSAPVVHAEDGERKGEELTSPARQRNIGLMSSSAPSGVAEFQSAPLPAGLQRSDSGFDPTSPEMHASVKASKSTEISDESEGRSRSMEEETRSGGKSSGLSSQKSEILAEKGAWKPAKQDAGKFHFSVKNYQRKDCVASDAFMSGKEGVLAKKDGSSPEANLSAPVEKELIDNKGGEPPIKRSVPADVSSKSEVLSESRPDGGDSSVQSSVINVDEGEGNSTEINDSILNGAATRFSSSEPVVVLDPSTVENSAEAGMETHPPSHGLSPDVSTQVESEIWTEQNAKDLSSATPKDSRVACEKRIPESVEPPVGEEKSSVKDRISNIYDTMGKPAPMTAAPLVEWEVSGVGPNEQLVEREDTHLKKLTPPRGSAEILPPWTSASERESQTEAKLFPDEMTDKIGNPDSVEIQVMRAPHISVCGAEGKHSVTSLDSDIGASERGTDSERPPVSILKSFSLSSIQVEDPFPGSTDEVPNGTCSDDGVHASSISRTSSDVQSASAVSIEEENTISISEDGVPAANPMVRSDNFSSLVPEAKLAPSKRKKRKDLLVKADAQGPTADLFTAYKAPEEKKHDELKRPDTPGPSVTDSGNRKNALLDPGRPAIKELDDWEDAAELPTPKASPNPAISALNGSTPSGAAASQNVVGIKKYTKDYLLSQRDLNRELPPHFEIRADKAENLLVAPLVASSYTDVLSSPGRGLERSGSCVSRSDRRTNAVGPEDDRWSRPMGAVASPGRGPSDTRMEMPGPPGGFRPGQGTSAGLMRVPPVVRPGMAPPGMMLMSGILPGVHHGMTGQASGRNVAGVDADRWQRAPAGQKGLIPSPRSPLPAMHKTDNRYQVGNISDEEQSKQRLIKGILNKLTPQNFDKLFGQVKEINIDSATSLTGVISQIFDKALTEPTFCEMYAQFCVQLAGELPEFVEEEEKITFKRVLLNKCQEEFEREQREQEEAEKVEEDGEVKLSAEDRDERRIAARRRMLGNIRFIGELYKKNMLTERIMHECIKKLLGEFQNPYEEDVEALCKLMTTIGKIIDHAKAKEHIDAYFKRMEILSENMKLSSRLRFMLKDCIDLRRNGWTERRKIEGPKKIEDVHRDAVQERQQAASGRDRPRSGGMGPGIGRRSANEFPMRGPPSPLYPPGGPVGGGMPVGGLRGVQAPGVLRGTYGQDVRMEDRLMMDTRPMPIPLSQRSADEGPLTLGPQGNLGRGMGVRTSLGHGRSALADVPPMLHSEVRRPGMGMGVPGYGGIIPDRGAFPGREELSKRGAGAERPLGVVDRPLLERPGRDIRGPDALVERPGHSIGPAFSLRPITPPNPVPARSAPVATLPLTEEELRKKSISTITEFFSVQDMKEAGQCVEDLKTPSFHPAMVSVWVSEALDRKDKDREQLAKLLIYLSQEKEPPALTEEQIRRGFELVLAAMEDTTVDVPRAPEYVGGMLSKLIVGGVFALAHVGKVLKEGGMDPGSLLETGDALNILGVILDTIRKHTGETAMLDFYRDSKLNVEDFIAPEDKRRSGKFEMFLEKKNLLSLYPIFPLEKYFREAMAKDKPTSEILKWVKENVPQSTTSDPAFLRMVMTQVLRHSVPLDANGRVMASHLDAILEGNINRFTMLLKACLPEKERALESSQRHYIVAVQLFANELGHPPGLMSILFQRLYVEDVISENVFQKWKDDVKDSTPGRDRAIKETFNWFRWLDEAPEEDEV